ncbi:MAG TPA: SDR family oxidoreductase, partial [Longimicrobiales bacterium]|nr:SDR family oxidoreductase [Longimicrobiales bacterium]
ALFERADQELEGLDLFVGNAGIWPPEEVPISSMEDARWRRTLAVNLDSIFHTTRAALRRLRDGGRVVLVSSTAGQRGEAYHGDYAATKGAIISLVKGLCVEVAERGITVNVVAPGWVDTEMSESALAGGERERIAASIPIGRIATAEDVAGPILFLCSPLARHVTGEVVNVNGGAVLVG